MSKVTLDMNTFKALASDTRLDILKTLDGKKMGLNDISKATNLNKATLHEHLVKLNEAGLVKRKEREGHKWVYYKLTWKGEKLLHPENTRIVVLFTITFIALWSGIIQLINYAQATTIHFPNINFLGDTASDELRESAPDIPGWSTNTGNDKINIILGEGEESLSYAAQNPIFLQIAIVCFIIFFVVLCVSIWRYNKNKKQKL